MLVVRCVENVDQIQEFDLGRVSEALRSGAKPLWFHVESPTPTELEFLAKELRIHHLTLEDIVKQNQRAKIEAFDNYVYIAMHPLVRKNAVELAPAEVDLLLGHHWLVTAYYEPIPGLAGNSHACYTVVDLIVDSYFPLLDQIAEEINALEDRLLGTAKVEDMNRLLNLKRSLVVIRRAVGPQREVFNQLTRHDFPFVRPEHTVYFRDVYDHLIRIYEELDGLRDILSGALEVHLSSISNQLNLTMKRLAAWGTIFVVITAIAGIYGMNFEFMPELRWRYGYFASLILMALISVGLYLHFRRKDYL